MLDQPCAGGLIPRLHGGKRLRLLLARQGLWKAAAAR